MRNMKAASLHAIGDFRVDTLPVPTIQGEELLVKIGACGICGSDIPRIFELGTSKQKYPLTIGHEFSGTIEAAGPDADQGLVGKRGAFFPLIPCRKCDNCLTGNYAMCDDYDYLGSRRDGAFADYCAVPSAWHFVASHNPKTTLEALSMTEPATVAQHAIRKSGLSAGNSIVIFGAGPIGIIAARWAKIFGAALVLLVDISDEKVAFAQKRGIAAINGTRQDFLAELRRYTGGKLADVVIEGTGSGAALNNAIHCVKAFGTITLMGNPHKDTTIGLAEHSMLLRKEVAITSVWNSYFANQPINEWHYTVSMLDEGRLVVEDLITHKTNLDGLPQLCADIRSGKLSICKAMFHPE